MSRMLSKMNLISVVQQLPKEDIETIQGYVEMIENENNKYKGVIDKAINNSQYWIDYYTRLNSDERIALRLQENIDILKEVE